MQMHQPDSPAGIEKNILINRGVIGLDKWDNEEAGQQDAFQQKIMEGDIVAIKNGSQFIALVEVDGPYFEVTDDKEFDWLVRRRKVKILEWYRPELDLKVSSRGTLTWCDQEGDAESTKSILKWYNLIQSGRMKTQAVELLKYKKQIILQGPPGTGKTRLAKEIVSNFSQELDISSIPEDYFLRILSVGTKLKTKEGYLFDIESVNGKTISLRVGDNKSKRPITIDQLKKIEIENGKDSYAQTLAKSVKDHWFKEKNTRIVQFHPSYSYEDFVRGMVAESNDGQIAYRTKNQEFGEFCDLALKEFLRSKPVISGLNDIDEKEWVKARIADFADNIIDLLESGETFPISSQVKIVEVGERGFRYQGNWSNSSLISNEDLISMYLAKNNSRQEVKYQEGVSKSAFYHATYYFNLLQSFRKFLSDNKLQYDANLAESREPQPYIFIIDEINRANLSSVLGELIYALEYRGERVKSMYDISGNRDFIVPPNLYIIGTMNTADRSVGHIDYAIRRRFAFVDVPPSEQPIRDVVKDPQTQAKALSLFQKVGALFQGEYLNSDFKAEEVQLGHSYFLAEDEATLKLKLDFEIKPLLKEYVKDGILNEKAASEIEKL